MHAGMAVICAQREIMRTTMHKHRLTFMLTFSAVVAAVAAVAAVAVVAGACCADNSDSDFALAAACSRKAFRCKTAFMYVCMYVRVCMYVCILDVRVCLCSCMFLFVSVCVSVHVYVRMQNHTEHDDLLQKIIFHP